ncbi:MAG: metalloregulator ArsR/SmtB family transcription factor [Actinomycetota bacterium]|nr:metalloregulator ArsR/SmtB family transcription factor [Actinomycetota bacterium]
MADRVAKDRLFEALASSARAMGEGRRAELVDVLAQGERGVDELAKQIGQSTANTSHHLKALAAAGLVTSRRAGTRVFYRLASPLVEQAWDCLRQLAACQIAEFDQVAAAYLGDRGDLPVIGRDALADRVRAGAVVLDVRPEAEYYAGHIPGALPAPPEQLQRLDEFLPLIPDGEVIAYCRGEFCVFADDAVRALRAAGRPAARLEDGFPQWRRAGLPVVTGITPGVLAPAADAQANAS